VVSTQHHSTSMSPDPTRQSLGGSTDPAFCPESPALLRAVSRRAGKTDDSGLMASASAPTRPPGDAQAGEGDGGSGGGAASGGRVSLSVLEIRENKDSRDREKASARISVATSGAGGSAQGEGAAPPTVDRGVRGRRGRGGYGGRFGCGNTMASKGDAPAKPSIPRKALRGGIRLSFLEPFHRL
jgi:hypothetical protein